MTINVGIDDFERIGRQVSRATLGHLCGTGSADQRHYAFMSETREVVFSSLSGLEAGSDRTGNGGAERTRPEQR